MNRANRSITMTIAASALLMLPLTAWAQPKVGISIKAEKEVVVTANKKQLRKRIEAKKFLPGEEIIYTMTYINSGTEAARDVVISDPIPSGTTYIPGSASDTDDLTFSIDHGKMFKKPALLTSEIKSKTGGSERKTASAEEYTDIRWTIQTVPAGGQGSVSFKVKVK